MLKLTSLFFTIWCQAPFLQMAEAKTYLPSGCSTVTDCKDSKNDKGELDGPQICVNYYKKDIVVIKAQWKNDKLDKDFFCANDDGVPQVEAKYKDGELHGLYKEYDSSLKKWGREINYANGKREGVSKDLLSEERIRITNYKNDKAHGFSLILDKNGKILYLTDCEVENHREKDDICNDIAIPGYEKLIKDYLALKIKVKKEQDNRQVLEKYKNGNIKERYTLKDGKIVGELESFYENGKPKIITKYNDGQRVEEKVYFREGPIESHIFYDLAWGYKVTTYYQNGNKKFEKLETKNKDDKWLTDISYKHYHDNGQISEEGKRIRPAGAWGDGYFDGDIKYYTKSGALVDLNRYNKGKRIGTWKSIPERGDYDYEVTYEDDVKIESKVLDKKTQKLLRKIEVYPDGSTKSEFVEPSFKDK